MPVTIPSLPLVSSAVAAMAAYAAYELQRKREEELAAQAAEEERREKGRAEARARAEAEWDRASAMKKAEQAHTSNVYAQLRNQQAEKERTSQTYAALCAQAAEKERQKANDDFRKGERESGTMAAPQPKSWLQNAWDNTRNFVQEATTAVTATVQSVVVSIPKPGGPKVLAEPVPVKKDGDPWEWIKKIWNWLTGGGNPPQITPTPNATAIFNQALQTAVAQYTAQAKPTSTPIPTVTPTLFPPSMWVTIGGTNFHIGDPNGIIPFQLPVKDVVIPTGNTQKTAGGLVYKEVKVNGQTGWVLSNFLEGVVTNSTPLVADPIKMYSLTLPLLVQQINQPRIYRSTKNPF